MVTRTALLSLCTYALAALELGTDSSRCVVAQQQAHVACSADSMQQRQAHVGRGAPVGRGAYGVNAMA
jgi:hypothetical protein